MRANLGCVARHTCDGCTIVTALTTVKTRLLSTSLCPEVNVRQELITRIRIACEVRTLWRHKLMPLHQGSHHRRAGLSILVINASAPMVCTYIVHGLRDSIAHKSQSTRCSKLGHVWCIPQ